MTRSESIAALAAALSKAQGAIRGAAKDRMNPHFKSAYADLASVWDACRTQLAANGIAVVQGVEAEGGTVRVETTLAHASGEWMSSVLSLTASPATPQGVGSAITYGRRYGLSSMVGIAPDDDDGNAASEGAPLPPKPAPAPEKPAPKADAKPPHIVHAWEMAKRVYGPDAKAKWNAAVTSVIGPDRASGSLTQQEALDVEAIIAESQNPRDIAF